ncbi:hypothetical protein Q0M94_26555 (plasmid) [Deinococcus radiomollis]|uniref:hypothetical protein n=1 Tax=Deinococcus radiomollis TaxID=468916 RepID=UPI0038918941
MNVFLLRRLPLYQGSTVDNDRFASMKQRDPKTGRGKFTGRTNLIGPRLRSVRLLHQPPMTIELVVQRASLLSGFVITANMVTKIETQRRAVYDYEVYALSLAVGVDPRFLLGFTDDPGPLELLPLQPASG